ncbi:acetyl-CoA carboxylase carboxyl transferase subunit alpha [Constrictibacter sp. MBR-5]|jgi:acetyl-CoA carboxylase carboxyl transferase subunit alpha
MVLTPLDFEKPIIELEAKIEELRHLSHSDDININKEVGDLQAKADRQLRQIYAKLTPWQKVQVARHPNRPHLRDYLSALIDEFTPLAGDRLYGEDAALVGGLGRLYGRPVVVMGHEKGHDIETRMRSNFGMAHPEGYRKAQRLMDLADRFALPLVSFVDTPGAYPGVQAEERGQAEAIARAIARCLELRVPFVSVVIGEGGSGGAVAIATANRVLMLEHSIYSVISPEGCASILWRSAENAKDAADALKLTAQDLTRLGVVDQVVEEPLGGAHRHPKETVETVGRALETALDDLRGHDGDALRRERREKFLSMGRSGLT